MRLDPQPRAPRGEPVLPLVNVVFIIVLFLMMHGPLASAPGGDAPDLAEAAAGRPAGAPPALVLDADGGLRFEGEPLALGELAGRLGADPPPRLAVHADRRAAARRLTAVATALEAAGVGEVVLTVRRR
jgi:biopolymer transport protein ExbD